MLGNWEGQPLKKIAKQKVLIPREIKQEIVKMTFSLLKHLNLFTNDTMFFLQNNENYGKPFKPFGKQTITIPTALQYSLKELVFCG